MKRNIVPLLGIAFVVAIISTGIFYGLFAGKLRSTVGELPEQSIVVAARTLNPGTVLHAEDLRVSEVKGAWKGGFSKPEELVGVTILQAVQQNEPILQDRVASNDGKSGKGAGGVPAGMRAVSIRVAESNGVVSLLRPGTKVDVQAVSRRENSAELRTILQNVEVLAVSPQPETAGGNQTMPVVTVLTRAQDADLIALGGKELEQVGLGAATDVVDGCVIRQPKAYPAYDDDYQRHVVTIRRELSAHCRNLHLVGRNGMHKYNNQDHAMMTALLAARNILAGENKYDVWSVNEDGEYHESGPAEETLERFGTSRLHQVE